MTYPQFVTLLAQLAACDRRTAMKFAAGEPIASRAVQAALERACNQLVREGRIGRRDVVSATSRRA